ncbi:MAG: shikimate kinase [Spirochaetaceae bacterium]|jgi:shikimate kinase|nr:shikimate kinase [Spirochaetaceae bacterium]
MTTIIALAGPKHSGKTCAGRAFAALTGAAFFDLDDEIGICSGKSARELYKLGKDVFQTAEWVALKSVLRKTEGIHRAVIALGGGFSDNRAARALLEEWGGHIVFLAVSAETAWKRIEAAQAKSGELPAFLRTADPRQTHREIHERRAAACRNTASFVVEAENKTAAEIAVAIDAAIAAGVIWESSTP